jgi:hypothetical protein
VDHEEDDLGLFGRVWVISWVIGNLDVDELVPLLLLLRVDVVLVRVSAVVHDLSLEVFNSLKLIEIA